MLRVCYILWLVSASLGFPGRAVARKDLANPQFIVIARIGDDKACRVIPEDNLYTAVYSKKFGPAPRAECEKWVAENCVKASRPDGVGEKGNPAVVYSVDFVRALVEKKPHRLQVIAKGQTTTAGWTQPALRLIGQTNGIYYFQFIAAPPVDSQPAVKSEIFASTTIESPAPGTRGARVIAELNSKISLGGIMSRGTAERPRP